MGRLTVRAHIKSVIITLSVSVCLMVEVRADINWTTLTSLREVRRMRTIHDTVFAATAGGLLALTDPTKPGAVYDNLSSLRATDLTDIIEAADGQKWVAAHGRLIRFGGTQSEVYPFIDVDGNPVRLLCIADDGDNLWVGTSIGLVLFSKVNDGGQIQDNYQMFGTLDAAPNVNDILLAGDSIWLATSAGIAVADRTIPNRLKVPSFWTTYGPGNHPELGTSQPRRIVLFESNYYIGTSLGLFRLDRTTTDTLVELPVGTPPWVTELKIENDSLFCYVPDGLYVMKSGYNARLGTFLLPIFPTNGTSTGVYRWMSLLGESSLYQNSGGPYVAYPHTGLPANRVADVAITQNGAATVLFASRQAQILTDSGWIPRTSTPAALTCGHVDSRGSIWIGTWGEGLFRIGADSNFNYDEANSSLRGNDDPNGEGYVVIRGLASNDQYIFAACYRAINGYPVVLGDLDHLDVLTGWDSLGMSDGITNHFVTSLDIFGSVVAVGTLSQGVFTVDLGPNPRNKADDTSFHFTAASGFLVSDNILCVRFSPTGDLWVGTSSGASQLRSGYPRFIDVELPLEFGNEVRAIEFDSRGNVWLGSSNGVARRDAADAAFTVFNSQNSGLVSDAVNNIRYDEFSGDTYIATEGGLSIARSQFGKPTDDIKNVLAFPNPFVIRSSSDILRFNFAQSGTVRILTLAGERVAEREIGVGWDGKNDGGKPAASGVYFFILTSDDGEIGSGKFLLIREQ